MTAATLSAEKVQHWLRKTAKSISNCPGGRDLETNYRLSELCSRYDDLKDRASELDVWNSFCEAGGWCRSHDGADLTA